MRVAETNADISDRFKVLVDPEADPTDLDEALAEFLLSYVRSTSASQPVSDCGRNKGPAESSEKCASPVDSDRGQSRKDRS